MFSDLASDLRLALRSLRLRPGFAALVVLTLALGIGATTAVFGLANQVLLRPLPGVADPGGAAYLEFRMREDPERSSGISALDFLDLRAAATSLEGLAAYVRTSQLVSVGDARPLRVMGNIVDGDYFEALGVEPVRGRLLSSSETGLDADPSVVVISERLWSTLLARSEDVVGRSILLNGEAVTIVGVAGGGFAGATRHDPIDVWRPQSSVVIDPERLNGRQSISHGSSGGGVIARPRPGVTMAAAEAEAQEILGRLARESPLSGTHLAGLRPRLFPGLHTVPASREATSGTLRIMTFVVVLVLLISCANAANLLLFRSVARKGTVAVRRALGATAGRIARQELVESVLLAAMGGVAGLGVAWLVALLFRGERLMFRAEEFQGLIVDLRVVGFAGAAILVTTLLAGILPAVLASRVPLTESLREAGRQETHRRAALRNAISGAQLALCIPLLVGALMLTRTVQSLYSIDLGMSPEGVTVVELRIGREPQEVHERVLAAARSVPGVEAAALDYLGPFWSLMADRVRLPTAASEEAVTTMMNYVTPGWFDLFRVEALSGRTFRTEDWDEGAPPRVVITAPLAHRLFGRTDVVGRALVSGRVESEIVGVIGELRMEGPHQPPQESVFLPYHRAPPLGLSLLVRTRGFDVGAVQEVQRAVGAIFPDLPAPEAALLTSRIDRQLTEQRLFARLLTLVSGITLLLAAVGLYGVIAFSVAARKRELGIRIALGSSTGGIARLVLGQAGLILGGGLLLGMAGAYALSRVLESRLFGVAASDATSYAAGALLLALVALMACVVPLRAAVRVDPAVTLREE
jgi:putative ABC transport system permease protein